MKLVIVDYGLGNLASVANALTKLEIPFEVSGSPAVIQKAKGLILPGVGAAGQGMKNLKAGSLDTAIVEQAKSGMPILGICLGMQLLFSLSEEGNTKCLGLVPGTVEKFQTDLKVPQIGWNQVIAAPESKLLKSIKDDSYFYFVHSYYCQPNDTGTAKGLTDYSTQFCSVVEQGNIFGVQFHPEKSGYSGLQVLRNFWEAVC
jgi:glutamine amidotransferase